MISWEACGRAKVLIFMNTRFLVANCLLPLPPSPLEMLTTRAQKSQRGKPEAPWIPLPCAQPNSNEPPKLGLAWKRSLGRRRLCGDCVRRWWSLWSLGSNWTFPPWIHLCFCCLVKHGVSHGETTVYLARRDGLFQGLFCPTKKVDSTILKGGLWRVLWNFLDTLCCPHGHGNSELRWRIHCPWPVRGIPSLVFQDSPNMGIYWAVLLGRCVHSWGSKDKQIKLSGGFKSPDSPTSIQHYPCVYPPTHGQVAQWSARQWQKLCGAAAGCRTAARRWCWGGL